MTTTTQTTTGATTDTTHVVCACPCDEGVDSHCPSCAAHGKAAEWCRVCDEPVHVSDLGTDGLCGECRTGLAEGRTGDLDADLADAVLDRVARTERVLHAGVDEPRVLLTDLIEGLRGAATRTATRTGDLHQAAGWAVDVYQTVGGRDPQQAFPAAVEAAVTRLGSDVLLAAAVRAIVARARLDGDTVIEAAGDGSCETCGGSDATACLCGELAPVGNLTATSSPRPAVTVRSADNANPHRRWARGCSKPTVAPRVFCTEHLQAAAAFAADRVRQGDAVDDPAGVADQDHDTDVVWCRACGEEPVPGDGDGVCRWCRAGVVGSLPAPTPARRAGRAGGAS